MRRGHLFVISGPSGVGKGTLVARLLNEVSDAWLSISATTRAPRPGEENGKSYYFLSEDAFKNLIEHDGFLEWACYAGNYYGTPKQSVLDAMGAGRQVILEIDVQGALQVRAKMPQARLVFIEPPSLRVLKRRLYGRGTESSVTIEKRLEAATEELAQKEVYDYSIVNDNLKQATQQLIHYVNSQAADQQV